MGRNSSRKSSSKTASKAAANKADAGNGSAAGAVADASPDAALQQGIAAAVRGDKDAAYKIFSETVELYPSVPEAWVWLGGTSPNLDNAETAFEKAYTLDPNNEQASLGLRWVRLQRKAALNGMMAPATAASETPSWSEMVSYAAPAEVANAGGQAATVQCPNCGKENSPPRNSAKTADSN